MWSKSAQTAQHRSTGHRSASSQSPCRRAFVKGQKDRRGFPLSAGLYKLEELHRMLSEMVVSIDAIVRWVRHGRPPREDWSFGSLCTNEDKASWLKSLPRVIARELGYTLIPAVKALGGDELTGPQVHRLALFATARAEALVTDCDELDWRLRPAIDAEYAAMNAGESHVLPLVRRVQTLAAYLLDEAYASRCADL